MNLILLSIQIETVFHAFRYYYITVMAPGTKAILLLKACSTCFLTHPRTTSAGVAQATVSLVPLYQLSIKKEAPQACSQVNFMGAYFKRGSLFQNDSGICQVNIKTSQNTHIHPSTHPIYTFVCIISYI